MEKYFRCEPGTLCDGARCCRSIESVPALSLGDYFRLSEYAGEPMARIWRNRGEIALSDFNDLRECEFLVSLGLMHDPCPYLSEDLMCGVYDARPLGCAAFPFFLLARNDRQLKENYSGYGCLDGIGMSREQVEFARELNSIMIEDADLTFEFLWEGKPRYVHTPVLGDYIELCREAASLQIERDPGMQSERSKKLGRTISRMSGMIESGEFVNGLSADVYASMLRPVMFPIMEDEIAGKMENLPQEALERCGRISERWTRLVQSGPGR
jgi:Fe-S-cluster containining protein